MEGVFDGLQGHLDGRPVCRSVFLSLLLAGIVQIESFVWEETSGEQCSEKKEFLEVVGKEHREGGGRRSCY